MEIWQPVIEIQATVGREAVCWIGFSSGYARWTVDVYVYSNSKLERMFSDF